MWTGKYPSQKILEKERNKIGDAVSWQREYLLQIIPDDDQVVELGWIKYYEEIPDLKSRDFKYVAITVDPAISEKSSADYTAIINAYVFGYGRDLKIYILPNPINKRMGFPKTIEEIRNQYDHFQNQGTVVRAFIEEVAFQKAISQQLTIEGYKIEGLGVRGDKRIRLSLTTPFIQNGQILFPKQGVDMLINQLVGFGAEKHDDLVDAFSLLFSGVFQNQKKRARAWDHKPEGW